MVSRIPSYSTDRLHREQVRQADEIAALQQDNHSRSGAAPAPSTAADIAYDPTTSGLAATDVQAAIDAVAASSYTDEKARDAIGAALVAGTNITLTVNDAGDTIKIDAAGVATIGLLTQVFELPIFL